MQSMPFFVHPLPIVEYFYIGLQAEIVDEACFIVMTEFCT